MAITMLLDKVVERGWGIATAVIATLIWSWRTHRFNADNSVNVNTPVTAGHPSLL